MRGALARRSVAWLATAAPRLLYGSLGAVARAPGGRPVTPGQVRAVFPRLSPAEAARASRQVRASALKNRALSVALSQARAEPVYPVASVDPAAAAVRPPAIIVTFHVGPFGALGHVLKGLPCEVLLLHDTDWRFPRNVVSVVADRGLDERAAAFYRAVRTLRDGGCVLLLAETIRGLGIDVPLLGGSVPLARGPFALARLTRAPIVPLFARWEGPAVAIAAGTVIPAGDDEAAMAAAAALALERYLLAHPGEIGAGLPREIIASRGRAPGSPAAR